MSGLQVSNVLAGLAVRNMEAAIEWTTRLLGRGPDARPMDGLADWHLPPSGTLQLVLDPARAGGSIVTLHVSDIASAQAALADRGIDMQYDDTTSSKVKFGQVEDADGNSVTLVESLSSFNPAASNLTSRSAAGGSACATGHVLSSGGACPRR
jgi:hypothetical protein